MKIDVKILNDGVFPIEPEGGGRNLELFGTKAVYTIINFQNGETYDFIIRSAITDPENVEYIDYNLKIFVKGISNIQEMQPRYIEIYNQNKRVELIK